jgi:pyridoxal phosphate enzyme (YggS family)
VSRLEQNLRAVRARIDAAARAAGRAPSSVALLAVSKTWPADDVRALTALGQVDFGENRAQELLDKAAALGDLALRWHFVGQLQRNKAAAVARLGAAVHSVDRRSLADVLDRAARDGDRALPVFVQVDLSGQTGRGGAAPEDVPALADAIAERGGLDLRGLMAVAPLGEPARPAFERLAAVAARVRADHPGAVELSAGMSGDLEEAIAVGATVVRVGTALFGDRPLPSGQDQRSPATRVTPVTGAPEAPGDMTN